MSAAFTVAEPTPPDAPTTASRPSEGTTVFFSEGAVATSNSLSFETIGLKSAGERSLTLEAGVFSSAHPMR